LHGNFIFHQKHDGMNGILSGVKQKQNVGDKLRLQKLRDEQQIVKRNKHGHRGLMFCGKVLLTFVYKHEGKENVL
jgi:hypothetical protein